VELRSHRGNGGRAIVYRADAQETGRWDRSGSPQYQWGLLRQSRSRRPSFSRSCDSGFIHSVLRSNSEPAVQASIYENAFDDRSGSTRHNLDQHAAAHAAHRQDSFEEHTPSAGLLIGFISSVQWALRLKWLVLAAGSGARRTFLFFRTRNGVSCRRS